MGRTHYDVLGITPAATAALVRAAYRARIRETHPDSGGDEGEAGLVNAAYAVLIDERARQDYDQTLHSGPSRTGTFTPSPATDAGGRPEAGRAHSHGEAFQPRAIVTPAWRRGKTARNLLLIIGSWLVCSAIVGVLVMLSSRAAGSTATVPEAALVILAPAAILAVTFTRARWWHVAISAVAYATVASLLQLGGLGLVLLIGTFVASGLAHAILASSRADLARELVAEFWAAAARPELSGWFIARSIQDRETCMVQLVDATGATRTQRTALLWGRHTAGSFVITDMASSPAQVLLTISTAQMKAARKRHNRR